MNTFLGEFLSIYTMRDNSITLFMVSYGKRFPSYRISEMKSVMNEITDNQFSIIQSFDYKDPNMIFVVSFLFGNLGIDRFLLGDTLLGVLKLLTCGGCFIWYIIDWFLIIDRTKEVNYQKFMQFVQDSSTWKTI